MRRKAQRYLAILLAFAMMFCVVPATGFAADSDDSGAVVSRIAGENRWDTAAKTAVAQFGTSEEVIIARGDDTGNYADGLAASYLAKVKDAPILLTNTNSLPQQTAAAITTLNAKKAYVLGGELAISPAVVDKLKDLGLTVERIKGKEDTSRVGTAAEIARMGGKVDTALLVSGNAPADSLIAGPVAYNNSYPVLLVNKDSVPSETAKVIDELGIENIHVVGGKLVVSDAVYNKLDADARYCGTIDTSRVGTSINVAQRLFSNPHAFSIVGSANKNLADAVGAAVLGNPILYVGNNISGIQGFLAGITDPQFTILGGTNAVSKTVEDALEEQINEDQTPIPFEEITPDIEILEPDSIGNVYLKATYTNNSSYPIIGYDLKILLKDINETTYLMTYDTVLPGETSPNFEGFGPQTQDPNDYEIIGADVYAKIDGGEILNIEYDFKLGEATWYEYDGNQVPIHQAPIRFEEITPDIEILEPDSIGNVYLKATYTNNSSYPIIGYDLKILLKDINETTYLMTYDTVLPGETSPNFEGFGPQTQDPNDYEIIGADVYAKIDGGEILIEYDFKLGEATWY
jgi:putative cell wall-binding protein